MATREAATRWHIEREGECDGDPRVDDRATFGTDYCIMDGDETVCELSNQDDAERIVRAVNSYDEMRGVLLNVQEAILNKPHLFAIPIVVEEQMRKVLQEEHVSYKDA